MGYPKKEAISPRDSRGDEGRLYVVSGVTTLGNGAVYEILIQVPANDTVRLLMHAGAALDATLELFEGTTVSAAGTAITPIRTNRTVSTPALNSTWTHTPTVTGDGTLLYTKEMDAGRNVGGSEGNQSEFTLAASTNYLIRITSNQASNVVDFDHWFYEI